ncbi:MAG: hypothetical protein M1828_000489 [Chrysothrix sp. TS-e1954]|nr:MAG: hypothetical protein M1828_000489 [Chrysothrix sp. TS-e1954]
MPRTTRLKKLTPPPSISSTTAPQLASPDPNPAELFILPSEASGQARIVSLPHPATSTPCRYLYCPDTGLYELTNIANPKSTPTSCLLAPDRSADGEEANETSDEGYVIQDAKVIVATPMDPLFFLAPLFSENMDQRPLGRTLEDHTQLLAESSEHMAKFLRQPAQRAFFEEVLRTDLRSAGVVDGEALSRVEPTCLFRPIQKKAQRITQKGLPRSLAAYSEKQLQVPSITVLPTESTEGLSSRAVGVESVDDEKGEPLAVGTNAAPQDNTRPTQEIANLNTYRIALDYLTQNYLPSRLHPTFQAWLQQNSKISFVPLDRHLAHVQKLRNEARALRSLSDNISRKRSSLEDDEAAEVRAEKRRKKEDEEKRKKAETRAVKDLKKVDTSGMKKMSSFFVKSAAAR